MEIKLINPGQGNIGALNGVCPHCERNVAFQELGLPHVSDLVMDVYFLGSRRCPNPNCLKHVFIISRGNELVEIYPPAPPEKPRPEPDQSVTAPYRDEYNEAAAVLGMSPKASAALSRRILQQLIRDKAGFRKANLSLEIDELLAKGGLPSQISEALDAIRNIGNFAAHPIKSTNTGEIVEVEAGEAEWNLDVLDMLFDFYFVQPALVQSKKDALNKKLQDAGKPPMK